MNGNGQHAIPDPMLEGSIRQLVVLAELASVTFYAFDAGDRQLLDGLQKVAAEVRDRLEEKKTEMA